MIFVIYFSWIQKISQSLLLPCAEEWIQFISSPSVHTGSGVSTQTVHWITFSGLKRPGKFRTQLHVNNAQNYTPLELLGFRTLSIVRILNN
jgi:hypothetical protein